MNSIDNMNTQNDSNSIIYEHDDQENLIDPVNEIGPRELADEQSTEIEFTFIEEQYLREDLLSDLKESSSLLKPNNHENLQTSQVDIPPIVTNEFPTKLNASPIEKLIEYVQAPVREDRHDLIESLLDLGSSLESIGVEAHQLTAALDETERLRVKALLESSKVGLNEYEFPIGHLRKDEIVPLALSYQAKSKINDKIDAFQVALESISLSSDPETKNNSIVNAKKIFHELNAQNYDTKRYVLNKNQKKGYFAIVLSDERIARTEVDLMLNFMKNSAFVHRKQLKQREEYYKAHLNGQEAEFPDIKPLLEDVKKLRSTLSVKLEEIPEILTSEEKQHLKEYLPALDEYYKDQIAAFSGGKSYLPLAKNLKIVQEEIANTPFALNIVKNAEPLGYTMQRLYLLHWVAESIMKQKYNKTLGKALLAFLQENPVKKPLLKDLLEAVRFRNDIAHNGIIWNPDDFERHIQNYEDGINILANELGIDLGNYRLEQVHKPFKKEELKHYVCQEIGATQSVIESVDPNLLETVPSKLHYKLKSMVDTLKKKNVTPEKLLEIDATLFKTLFRSKGKGFDLVNKNITNELFKTHFAKKYFNHDFEHVAQAASKKRPNSNPDKIYGLLFRLAMLEKEDKLTTDDLKTINELRRELYG